MRKKVKIQFWLVGIGGIAIVLLGLKATRLISGATSSEDSNNSIVYAIEDGKIPVSEYYSNSSLNNQNYERVCETTLELDVESGEKVQCDSNLLNIVSFGDNRPEADGYSDDSIFFRNLSSQFWCSEGEMYALDKDTLLKVFEQKLFVGDGSVVWIDWNARLSNKDKRDKVNGVIPVSLLDDPIFCSMKLPSEARHDSETTGKRVNGSFLFDSYPGYSKVCGTGAIYKKEGVELPETFTLCIGKDLCVFAVTVDQPVIHILENCDISERGYVLPSWNETLQEYKTKGSSFSLYPSNWNKEEKVIKPEIIYDCGDHVEIPLTGKDFEGRVLHFWTANQEGVEKENLVGLVTAYSFWVKEKEYEDMFVATIGTDFRDINETISQAFSGRGMLVKSYPRTIFGHNFYDDDYMKYVDNSLILKKYSVH